MHDTNALPGPQMEALVDEGLRWELAELMYRLVGICDFVLATYGADVDDSACQGEAEWAYRRIVRHIAGIEPLSGTDADLAERAATLMRRLGGCWWGDGCLYACTAPAAHPPQADDVDDGGDGPYRCTWASLDVVATASGQHLV